MGLEIEDLKFSNPWCVCMKGTLDSGHEKWPVKFVGAGGPYHWCPSCYHEAIEERRQEAEEDGVDGLDEMDASIAMDYAMVSFPGDTCDRGHEPPERG